MSETIAPNKHTTHAIGRDRLLGHLAMVTFAAMIGGSFTLGALTVPHVDSAPLNTFRFIIGTVVMGVYTFGIRRQPFRVPEAPWRYAILGAVMAIYFVAMFIALSMTSPVSTSAVFTLMPIMTAVIAFFLLGQTISPIVGVSLFIAALGSIWVIFRGELDAILSFDIGQGELIYFVGCIGHAAFAPLLRKFDRGEPNSVSSFFVVLATTIWVAIYGLPGVLATNWLALPPIAWIGILYLAIFTGTLTFMLMQFAAQRLPASKMLAYGYLVPGFVILYEGLAGHGWVSLAVALGALVTVMGLVVLYFSAD